jgi:Ca2+:H+ antiporter
MFSRVDRVVLAASGVLTVLAAVTRYVDLGSVTAFAVSGLAIAALASLVGRSVDQLADRLGAGATGVLQSALGNLPELFIALFALHEGLISVVQAAIVGSVLGNVLLILGLAFVAGGLKNGTQRFDGERARNIGLLLVLAVAALGVPTLTHGLHTPAADHERALSIVIAIALLVIFAFSVPSSLRRTADDEAAGEAHGATWPTSLAVGMLAASGVLAAVVSDWFVHALSPAIDALNITQTFAGLVIVAIAGNAVENVVGIQLAMRDKADHALSVILNSPLQIALVLAPVLILLAPAVTATTFTLVLPGFLYAALAMSAVLTMFVVVDGESTWLEGSMLLSLYVILATSFWWG